MIRGRWARTAQRSAFARETLMGLDAERDLAARADQAGGGTTEADPAGGVGRSSRKRRDHFVSRLPGALHERYRRDVGGDGGPTSARPAMRPPIGIDANIILPIEAPEVGVEASS